MAPLALITFMIWFLYLSLARRLRAMLANADIAELAPVDDGGRVRFNKQALRRLETRGGAVPRIIRKVIPGMERGLSFREAFQQSREAEIAPFSYVFYLLGALVAAAPLLGLLGTVLGMIETFAAVAGRGMESADMIASGVSKALITTQLGLVAALPGTFGLAHLHRLYQRLRAFIDQCESHLALIFEHPAAAGPETPRAQACSNQHLACAGET